MNNENMAVKVFRTFKRDGLRGINEKIREHICVKEADLKKESYRDFLFVYSSDCKYEQKEREIFAGQMKMLELFNYSTELIEEKSFTEDHLRYFKVFVLGKCSEKREFENLFDKIKILNKKIVLLEELSDFRLYEDEAEYRDKSLSIMAKAKDLIQYYKSVLPHNIGIFLPGLAISGGIRVALKHACILRESGKDVTLFTLDSRQKWYDVDGHIFPVINLKETNLYGCIDHAVATMWTTVPVVEQCSTAVRKSYLVQGFETDFYSSEDPFYVDANKTYSPHISMKFFTVSKWCQRWLAEVFEQETVYIRNGIELEQFNEKKREFSGKIRILIEGDCEAEYKNVDEAFQIVNELDSQKYEIWYMSYNGKSKPQYRVDNFLHKVPYEKVAEVYQQCHILLKTSLLESFSYPPLEMMATGGYVVAVPNDGNAEYMVDEYNCLLYSAGDLDKAKEQIERICQDENLRKKLTENAQKTVAERDWKNIEPEILAFYQ